MNSPRFPQLRRHKELVERLGLENVSSDEETRDANGPYFVSFRRFFLSGEVSSLFAKLDRVHAKYFQHGAPMARRVESQHLAKGEALLSLSYNVYNPAWLRTLTPANMGILNPQAKPYDFTAEAL